MEIKYTNIKNKYLADALSYLGFHYFKFQNEGKTEYSFENTEKFSETLQQLTALKDKLNN